MSHVAESAKMDVVELLLTIPQIRLALLVRPVLYCKRVTRE